MLQLPPLKLYYSNIKTLSLILLRFGLEPQRLHSKFIRKVAGIYEFPCLTESARDILKLYERLQRSPHGPV